MEELSNAANENFVYKDIVIVGKFIIIYFNIF